MGPSYVGELEEAGERATRGEVATQRQRRPKRAESDETLRQYLAELGAIPLLSPEQVVRLAKRIESGAAARARLALGVEPAQQPQLERMAADGERARQELIRANLRLVVSVAKKYAGHQLPLLDLIQEGNLGLIRAVEKFDWRNGAAFSTYAFWWIRQGIGRALMSSGRVVRLPVHLGEQLVRVRRASRALEQQLARPPTADELAAACGMSVRKVRRLLAADMAPVSLEQAAGPDGDTALGDMIPADRDDPIELLVEDQLHADIHAALGALPERERGVLMLRYGFNDGRRRTHDEVGAALGVSRERARQLEAEALKWLRRTAIRRRLESYRS